MAAVIETDPVRIDSDDDAPKPEPDIDSDDDAPKPEPNIDSDDDAPKPEPNIDSDDDAPKPEEKAAPVALEPIPDVWTCEDCMYENPTAANPEVCEMCGADCPIKDQIAAAKAAAEGQRAAAEEAEQKRKEEEAAAKAAAEEAERKRQEEEAAAKAAAEEAERKRQEEEAQAKRAADEALLATAQEELKQLESKLADIKAQIEAKRNRVNELNVQLGHAVSVEQEVEVNVRPTVGDTVTVIKGNKNVGDVGVIIRDDHDSQPYRLRINGHEYQWFKELEVSKTGNSVQIEQPLTWIRSENRSLAGHVGGNVQGFCTLEEAQKAALALGATCGGITLAEGKYELRVGPLLETCPDAVSWTSSTDVARTERAALRLQAIARGRAVRRELSTKNTAPTGRPTVGDTVKIIGGDKRVNCTGVITRDDHDSRPYKIKIGMTEVCWFTEVNVRKVAATATASEEKKAEASDTDMITQNVRVGAASSNNKVVSCPGVSTVNATPTNPQASGWNDRFEVTVGTDNFTVRRLDADCGWGQNLCLNVTLPRSMSRPTVGDIVTVIGGSKNVGETGTITRDDHDNSPYKISFNGNSEVCWFNPSQVRRAASNSVAVLNRRPTVGDTVTVTGGNKNVGQTGRITRDDHDNSPYKIDFGSGDVSWFKTDQVRIADANQASSSTSANSAATTRPTIGDTVTVIGGNKNVGDVGVITRDDHDNSPYKIRINGTEVSWFKENQVRKSNAEQKVIEVNARPTVGDTVTVIGGNKRVGEAGRIVRDDHDTAPYRINFNGTDVAWFKVDQVRKGEPAPVSGVEGKTVALGSIDSQVNSDGKQIYGNSIQLSKPVREIKCDIVWCDQGWGNQKGRVHLELRRGGQAIAVHDLYGVAPHSQASNSKTLDASNPVVNQAQANDVLQAYFTVGGGGGHRIRIQSFSVCVEPVTGTPSTTTASEGENKRPTVGDVVTIIGGTKNLGQVGTITRDDHDSSPYKIDICGTIVQYFTEAQVRLGGDLTPRPTVGDLVKVIGGNKRVGQVGTITRDDHDQSPYKITFNGTEICWFKPPEVTKVSAEEAEEAKKALSDRPTVGDLVKVTGGDKRVGEVGTITRDDHDTSPYKITFNGTEVAWFKPDQVTRASAEEAEEAKRQAAAAAEAKAVAEANRPTVGDVVKVTGGDKRAGEIGTITRDDHDNNPYKITFNGTEVGWFKPDQLEKRQVI